MKKILIVGGGIGGMTAAACLLKAGFHVQVFEQAANLGEVGAGIQLSANPMRVLRHLGLLEELEQAGVRPASYQFKMFDTAEVLQEIPLGDGYVERHGVPYLSVHRADLLGALIGAVRALNSDAVTLNANATDFSEDSDGVTLHFQDGGEARGDVLIGADGIKSMVRAKTIGPTPVHYTGDQSWRILVPAERLEPAMRPDTVNICVGPGKHGVVYPIRRNGLVNMVGCVEYETWDDESWTARRPWAEMKADFAGWHENIQAIIDNADRDECYRWAMNNRPPVDNWRTARTTLLGDAAHPTLPYMAQGGGMAIEDGAVIARALMQEDDVGEALDLYQRNRLERTARIVNESSTNRNMFHLPSEAALREAFAQRDMNAERTAWLFSYDPMTVDLR
ncbi:MAG: NAD(P)-binding protein [Rhodospirillaceae bacterium]|jgi:salicylate hydroxylase|nr:NAD(P)-binding protein [Rhodospirillaceae bacterium]